MLAKWYLRLRVLTGAAVRQGAVKDRSLKLYSLKIHQERFKLGTFDVPTVMGSYVLTSWSTLNYALLRFNPIHLFTNSSQKSTSGVLLGIETFSNV